MPVSARLITTRFDASSTADEVAANADLSGIRAIVTGGSSGIGLQTARTLTSAGADVTLAVRNLEAGARAAEEITRATGGGNVQLAFLDLAAQPSIERFVQGWDGPLDLLIDNAGIVTGGLERTPEGWELQFATNHLGHFALTLGLRDALTAGAQERGEARIVVLSSTAHMRAPVDFDDIQFERREYDPQIAYAQSKTANSLFAVEATRRWAPDAIFANTVNPGGVATGLQRDFTQQQKDSLAAAEAAGTFTYKTTQQGAANTLIAAIAPELAHTGGHYLDDGIEAYTVPNDASLSDHPHGVKEWALDPEIANRLWLVSLDLLGRSDDGAARARSIPR
jgi:NAD(P)-dependent dehydrogenase (short-subunit alcohol dehydrogenase family)